MILRQKQHRQVVAGPTGEKQDDTGPKHCSPANPLKAYDEKNTANQMFSRLS